MSVEIDHSEAHCDDTRTRPSELPRIPLSLLSVFTLPRACPWMLLGSLEIPVQNTHPCPLLDQSLLWCRHLHITVEWSLACLSEFYPPLSGAFVRTILTRSPSARHLCHQRACIIPDSKEARRVIQSGDSHPSHPRLSGIRSLSVRRAKREPHSLSTNRRPSPNKRLRLCDIDPRFPRIDWHCVCPFSCLSQHSRCGANSGRWSLPLSLGYHVDFGDSGASTACAWQNWEKCKPQVPRTLVGRPTTQAASAQLRVLS